MKKLILLVLVLITAKGFAQTNFLYPYSPDGKKWGLVDSSLRVVIESLYENEFNFYSNSNTAIVQLNKKQGLLNRAGKLIIPSIYDYIAYEYNELAKLNMNKKFGIASSKTGKLLLPVVYEEIKANSGIAYTMPVRKGNKWGIVNTKTWKQVGKMEFDEVNGYSEIANTAIVKKQLKYGMINTKTGVMILPVVYDELSYEMNYSLQRYFVSAYGNGVTQKFDGNGKLLKEEKKEGNGSADQIMDMKSEAVYEKAPAPPEEYSSLGYSVNDKSLYFYKMDEKKWKVTVEKRSSGGTEIFESFELQGYDTISKLENSSYLNTPVEQNKLKAKKDGKTGIINLKGDVFVNTAYDDIDNNAYGDYYKTMLNGLSGLIHKTNLKEIKKPVLKKIENSYSYNNLYRIEMPAGQIGYMNVITGKIYIPGITD
jgi:WG containing repeat